ncbi:MAG: ABC transporter substrate-binding protein [Pseudomonas sp.]|uniref:ABC transporter substrate-binding protein n=1 Tax=Pseudomonas sp. TaxID=306 RepID=UPI0027325A38|nr:ABC transporter substrate-binding protein [Pseudomonas sp.]MDP3847572.1 ABC transporter substrate-binding protein [Pseudomonas sp.]
MTSRPLLHLFISLMLGLLPGLAAWAENGVSADDIRIGMVNAQSGPAAGLGLGMYAGAAAYFARINAEGGVNGRKITLILKDDGYEPARSAALTEQLIKVDQVFALLGYVGTPTSRAALPIAAQAEVPYLFPFTGAEFLRTPLKKWAFNLRASYFDETEELVERINKDLGSQKVALLMQDDSFGEAVKSGLAGALDKRGMRIHAEARIQRNSLQVNGAVAALKLATPDAIVFVGTYQQLAAAIKQAKASGVTARFFTVSFIGTENFISAAGADGDGVYITQVMPSPHDRSLAVIRDYLADIKPSEVGYASLEGYIAAMVFAKALANTGAQPTRAELADALQYLNTDLGGFKVAFSPSNHQGSDAVFLTRVQAGKALPVKRMQ